jgi:hypothetical protein
MPLTRLPAQSNPTSLPRAPTTPGQWRCSSSSFLLLVFELGEVFSRTRDENEDEEDQHRRITSRWSLPPFSPLAWASSMYLRKSDRKPRILRDA